MILEFSWVFRAHLIQSLRYIRQPCALIYVKPWFICGYLGKGYNCSFVSSDLFPKFPLGHLKITSPCSFYLETFYWKTSRLTLHQRPKFLPHLIWQSLILVDTRHSETGTVFHPQSDRRLWMPWFLHSPVKFLMGHCRASRNTFTC